MDGDNMSEQDRNVDLQSAEAVARRAESEANIFRNRAAKMPNASPAQASLQERVKAGQDAQKELDRLNGIEVKEDLSGMSRGLSDSAGNFAANTEVARTGGIGIEASNTDAATGEPAQTADAAGVATQPGAQKVIADQPVGGASTSLTEETAATRAAVTIPDAWQGMSWQERRSIASQVSDTPIRNGDEADAAIEAELKRRSSAAA